MFESAGGGGTPFNRSASSGGKLLVSNLDYGVSDADIKVGVYWTDVNACVGDGLSCEVCCRLESLADGVGPSCHLSC